MQTAKLKNSPIHSWDTNSWKMYHCDQQPTYDDVTSLNALLNKLSNSPPIVCEHEIHDISYFIKEAANGHTFILQAGDCAESFADCNEENVKLRIQNIRNLAKNLQNYIQKPVIPIGRIAGQYAKPRSESFEIHGQQKLPCFKGDIINGIDFSSHARKANPERLLLAYQKSSNTMQWIRNFFDLHISYNRSLFFISHEALLLNYESSLTRKTQNYKSWYNSSAHFLWLGERTNQINSAHVEYLRGICNPIGIKLGPKSDAVHVVSLLQKLNPNNEFGKITLISRLGCTQTKNILPKLIKAVQKFKFNVTWMCDPMHGNGEKTTSGIKTRHFYKIWDELKETYFLHKELNSKLSGVHLELTPENVTECIGEGVTEDTLKKNYLSLCDPRLNQEQSHELICRLGELMKECEC